MLRTKVMIGIITAAAIVSALAVPKAEANPYTPRQYYSGWHKHSSYGYYYRTYYYKPSPTYDGYRHHYVVYYPSRPYYYYYNPYTKTYWGRCPVKTDGKGTYSLLAEKDRKGNLDDIPEDAFPKPGKLPKVPEATDDATLDLPPDDLPASNDTPAEKQKEEKK